MTQVWNFHVWNEMYFKRTDIGCAALGLPATCANGWQAVDATPQESSAGGSVFGATPKYQMGPASLALIKLNLNPMCPDGGPSAADDPAYGCFDNEFVIGETNARYNNWVTDINSAASFTTTTAGCACKQGPWTFKDVTVEGHCGNPDADAAGDWCFVVDSNCQPTASSQQQAHRSSGARISKAPPCLPLYSRARALRFSKKPVPVRSGGLTRPVCGNAQASRAVRRTDTVASLSLRRTGPS